MKRFMICIQLMLCGWLVGCGQVAETPPSIPLVTEPTKSIYPATATIFKIYQPDSGVRYRITETFLQDASKEVPNREAGEEVFAVGNSPGLQGTLALDLEANPPRVLGGDFTADLTLLRTNQQRRDERLRGQWLQTYSYPTATFVVDEQDILSEPYAAGSEVVFPLMGQLTVRDVTIPATFLVTAMLDEEMEELRATADAKLLISDLGIEPPSLANIVVVDDPFEIGVTLLARRE